MRTWHCKPHPQYFSCPVHLLLLISYLLPLPERYHLVQHTQPKKKQQKNNNGKLQPSSQPRRRHPAQSPHQIRHVGRRSLPRAACHRDGRCYRLDHHYRSARFLWTAGARCEEWLKEHGFPSPLSFELTRPRTANFTEWANPLGKPECQSLPLLSRDFVHSLPINPCDFIRII
ncbi:hypothetical protein GGR50DRAFT_44422 [Xylaria sp. CBS 124048]|nr:hypothetical protein GGR50DRAFT_44422 [Xylaria sp. CBS 124048]